VEPSVLMSVYNEAVTLAEAVESVLGVVHSCCTGLVLAGVGRTDQAPEIPPAS
jgi:hypothetical protein